MILQVLIATCVTIIFFWDVQTCKKKAALLHAMEALGGEEV
jgi:hypothetical protein